jgi:hypothetical protein
MGVFKNEVVMSSNPLSGGFKHFTNLHFDVMVATLALGFRYIQWTGPIVLGVQRAAVAAVVDRAVMALGGLQIHERQGTLSVRMVQGSGAAIVEEMGSRVVLWDRPSARSGYNGPLWLGLRVVVRFMASFVLGITVMRAFRHPGDTKTQDMVDYIGAIAWAVGREIVLQQDTGSSRFALFMLVSNSLIFGAIEGGKMPSHFQWKFLSGALFRAILDIDRLSEMSDRYQPKFAQSVVAHLLFNLSRSFSS